MWSDDLVGKADAVVYSVTQAPNDDLFLVGADLDSDSTIIQSRTFTGAVGWTIDLGLISAVSTIAANTNDGGAVCWGMGDTVAVLRFTSDGSVRWTGEYIFPGATSSDCLDLVVLEEGGIVVVGHQTQRGSPDALVVRFSDRGDVTWASAFDGLAGSSDEATAVDKTDDGRIVVGGRVRSVPGNGSDSDAWIAVLEP